MPQPTPENLREIQSLVEIVASLRGPGGCPWDREQTLETLTTYALEEAAEYTEAVLKGEPLAIREELGDLLLQVILNSQIAKEEGLFSLEDVVETISEKMVRRHPHVFGSESAANSTEVLERWDELKAAEKNASNSSWCFQVPAELPGLMRAAKIGRKTAKLGFDWLDAAGVWAKVAEELEELKQAEANDIPEEVESELGDVLFSLAQLGRHLGLDPERALRKANLRFEQRFSTMVASCEGEIETFSQLSDSDKERLWQQAKDQEAQAKLEPKSAKM